jgi:uncharacterized protein (TIGR02099 family)
VKNKLYDILKFKLSTISFLILFLVSLYVLSARVALYVLPEYKSSIEHYLSDSLNQDVLIRNIDSHWLGLDPVVDINGLSINGSHNAYVGRIRVQLSFLQSLLGLSPKLKSISVNHSEVAVTQSPDGSWSIASYKLGLFDPPKTDTLTQADVSPYIEDLLNGAAVNLNDVKVLLHNKSGLVRTLRSPNINLNYRNDHVYASGQVLEQEGDNTLLNFSLEGQGVLAKQAISGMLYVEARSAEFFGELLKVYDWEQISINEIEGNARAWLSFKGLSVEALQGDIQLSKVNWSSPEKSLPAVQNLALSYALLVGDEASSLMVDGLAFNVAGRRCEPSKVKYGRSVSSTSLDISYLDIGCVSELALASGLLSESLKERLEFSQAEGALEDISVFIDDAGIDAEGQKEINFELEANLKQVSLNAYESTPSGKGIDGYVFADKNGGFVNFVSENFELGFPTLFLDSWKMKLAEGSVSWAVLGEETTVRSDGLRLWQKDDSLVYGDFVLTINPEDKEDYLGLSVAMQDISFENAPKFIPALAIGTDLHEWLDNALLSGFITDGVYYGYGSTEDNNSVNSFTSSILLNSYHGSLSFSDDWPPLEDLKAQINLQNGQLLIEADTASIHGNSLKNLSVEMLEVASDKTSVLSATSDLKIDTSALGYWLTESPISNFTQSVAEQIDISGELAVSVDLDIPVSDGNDHVEVGYLITANLDGAEIYHKDSEILFSDVVGSLQVSADKGVTANNLQLTVFDDVAGLSIETKFDDHTYDRLISAHEDDAFDDLYKTVFELDGGTDIAEIFRFLGYQSTAFTSGELQYNALLELPNHQYLFPKVAIKSDLVGVQRDWPIPFEKNAGDKEALTVSMLLKPDQIYLDVLLDTHTDQSIESELLFIDNTFSFGEILVNGRVLKQPDVSGLNISANLTEIKLFPWIDFIDQLSSQFQSDETKSEPSIIKLIELSSEYTQAFGQSFKDTEAIIKQKDERWQVGLSGSDISGQVFLENENEKLEVKLSHIKLVSEPSSDGVVAASSEKSGAVDPKTIPEMYFETKALVFDQSSFGAWSSMIVPTDDGVIFSELLGISRGSEVKGQLNWQRFDDGQQNSILTLEVKGDRFEHLLEALDLPALITSKKFSSTLALVWPLSPLDFGLGSLSGSMSLTMSDGFLQTDDEKTGILRLFGVLNAESITRRLKLDFSDLYKSGVGFDSFNVKATMDQGLLTIVEPLNIKGPSGDYTINGVTDLGSEALDLDMLVELPFSQNLPLAALVLGAPQIGGLVWVADKLLGEPLSALTTSRYDITGSWSEPVIELDQVVNASSKNRVDNNGVRPETKSPSKEP